MICRMLPWCLAATARCIAYFLRWPTRETPLLVVPTGSANDFARCLGIPSRGDALRAWRRYLDRGDNVRTIDLGVVHPMGMVAPGEAGSLNSVTFADAQGRISRPASPLGPVIMRHHLHHAEENAERQRAIYFSGIAGIGLDAETNRRADRMPGWLRRHGGYLLAALRALASYAPPTVRLHSFDASGKETVLDGPVLFAAIGNAPEYGSGIRMLPQAELDDGQLDLCFVPAMPKSLVLRHIHRIYSGTHLLVPKVRYLRTLQLFLESDAAAAHLCRWRIPLPDAGGDLGRPEGAAGHRSLGLGACRRAIPD